MMHAFSFPDLIFRVVCRFTMRRGWNSGVSPHKATLGPMRVTVQSWYFGVRLKCRQGSKVNKSKC
jgi:hypothetical protein